MKYLSIYPLVLFLLLPHFVNAKNKNNTVIESASQFQRWCKTLSYHHFRTKKQQPYNWSASTIRQLNDYQTTGSWKVNNVEKDIFCQIRIGKRVKQMKMKIK